MAEKERPRLSSLSMLGFQINGFLEEGNHGLTFEDVYNGLDDGTLWQVMNSKIPDTQRSRR